MNYDEIGKFIASKRKEKNLTQKELADKLHITDRAISKWECGKGCPDISLLEDLSSILGISVIEILKGKSINKQKINDNDIMYSLNLYQNKKKEKIDKFFNIFTICLVIVIALFIAFSSFKSDYYFNKKYYPNLLDVQNIFDGLDKKLDLVLNNQGKYTNSEYQSILSYINNISKEEINNDYNLYNKSFYSYNDIKNTYDFNSKKEFFYKNTYLFKIILKYNPSKVDIPPIYDICVRDYYNASNAIKSFISNSYTYYKVYDGENIANDLKSLISSKYSIYELILDNIIEVGELNG